MKRILIVTLLLLASGPASAAFYSTEYLEQLLQNCSSLEETFDASSENFARVKDCGLSTGYILGVFDGLNVISDRSKCIPGTIQSEQVVAVVENWILKHPERRSEAADKSVRSAFAEAWACTQ